jgi:hypothetical protein
MSAPLPSSSGLSDLPTAPTGAALVTPESYTDVNLPAVYGLYFRVTDQLKEMRNAFREKQIKSRSRPDIFSASSSPSLMIATNPQTALARA